MTANLPANRLDAEGGGQPDAAAAETTAESAEAEDRSGNHEAARYRRQLRDAEAQRDQLATQVERLQQAEVARLAGARLAQPADLFSVGQVALGDLLNDSGEVEPALVDTAVLGLLEARPGLGRDMVPQPRPGFGQGSLPPVTTGGEKSWSGLLRKGE